MAHGHGHDPNEKIVYVGDSRVRKNTKVLLPADYTSFPGKSEAFIPNFLLKEWMVGCVVLVGILALVISEPAPLGYPANPTNTAFIPMPDWYFLFMYQLLKYPYTSDAFVVLGTLGIPGLMFGALTLAPFLDTGKERRFYRRPIASSLMFLTLVAVIYLTRVSWAHYQEELKINGIVPEHIEREQKMEEARKNGEEFESPKPAGAAKEQAVAIVDESNPAMEIYKKSTCVQCHSPDLKGMANAGIPALRGVGDKFSKDELVTLMKDGIGKMPGKQWEESLKKGLTDADMDALATWLAAQKAEK
ncbi:c-type cytochrome [Paenibacillus turpanensis]|uniref:c-type cytochrome n=1 Tax=Paenibacillus turpanensis TaxID=2689078 RepID=UPI00140BAA42